MGPRIFDAIIDPANCVNQELGERRIVPAVPNSPLALIEFPQTIRSAPVTSG